MAGLGELEAAQKEAAELATMVESHRTKSAQMKTEITETVAKLQAEIDSLKGPRDVAAAALPPKARGVFDRLAEHHEGEALSAIFKPDRRKEEYACSVCMMDLVTDVYNKLHTRDEITFCPSCRRVLYIPDDLPPEMAVNKRKGSAATASSPASDDEGVPSKAPKPAKSGPRAKGSLGTLLAAAQGESVKNAVDAKQDAVEFNVLIDGKLAGHYKGKSQENLERIIRYRLEEANLVHTIAVEPIPTEPPAAAPAVSSVPETPAETTTPDEAPAASHDPGMPETPASDVSTPAEPPVVNA